MRRSKEDAEQTRTAILDAAEMVFCDQGIAAATLERISRTAGVTRGAFYWHFKDKQCLLNALRERSAMPQEALMRAAAADGHDDPLGMLGEASAEVLALLENDERRQRLFTIMCGPALGDETACWLTEVNTDMFGVLCQLMQQARDKDTLCPDFSPEDAAVLMMCVMTGIFNEWQRSGKAFPLAELGGKIMRKQISLLRATPS